MFESMVRRLLRRPWSLGLVGGLVVLLGAAFLVAGPARSSLFGSPPSELAFYSFMTLVNCSFSGLISVESLSQSMGKAFRKM